MSNTFDTINVGAGFDFFATIVQRSFIGKRVQKFLLAQFMEAAVDQYRSLLAYSEGDVDTTDAFLRMDALAKQAYRVPEEFVFPKNDAPEYAERDLYNEGWLFGFQLVVIELQSYRFPVRFDAHKALAELVQANRSHYKNLLNADPDSYFLQGAYEGFNNWFQMIDENGRERGTLLRTK